MCHGMQPVREHPSYCKNDAKAKWLYLGQAHHVSHPPHANVDGWWFPSGRAAIKSKWNWLCAKGTGCAPRPRAPAPAPTGYNNASGGSGGGGARPSKAPWPLQSVCA